MQANHNIQTPIAPLVGPQTTSRLQDLWQAEEQLSYRLDAWLIKYLRSFNGVSSEQVSQSRRTYANARHKLAAQIASRGRAVARIPFVSTIELEPSLSAAARQLQNLHRELMRLHDRADQALQSASRDRDFASVAVLAEVSESHFVIEHLIRDLFQTGQRISRKVLTAEVA